MHFNKKTAGVFLLCLMASVTVSAQTKKAEKVKTKSQTSMLDSVALNDVVVIGYGTARKKDLTGAVSTVKGDKLTEIPVGNITEALEGKLAGVSVTTADGSPDADVVIRVRGGNSITQSNDPLYIVDGFPVSTISDLNPNDIDDITVLKDAASTAIYGAQGANGVILITTKVGARKSGFASGGTSKWKLPSIDYNGYIQGKSLSKTLATMTPLQYVKNMYEYYLIQGNLQSVVDKFGEFSTYNDVYGSQAGTDWQNDLFGQSYLSTSHSLSISNSSEKTKYSLSGGYLNSSGLMANNGMKRFNISGRLQQKLSKVVTLDLNTRYSDTETEGTGTSGDGYKVRSYEAITKAPVVGLVGEYTPDEIEAMDADDYEQYINATRSLQDKANDYWRMRTNRRLNLNASVTWNISKSFTYRAEGGYEYGYYRDKNYFGYKTSRAFNEGNKQPVGELTNTDSWKYRLSHNVTWKKKFKKIHDFNVMLGQEWVASGSDTHAKTGKYFPIGISHDDMFSQIDANNTASDALTMSYTSPASDKTLSFFTRANYILKRKYLFTFTMRADGSGKFSRGNRWGYFPAFAAAWRLSDEKWMQGASSWLSNLKIRASIGTSGNNNIKMDQDKTTFSIYSGGKYYGADGVKQPGYVLTNTTSMENPNLKWETTTTRNLGIDFGFLNGSINGSVDLYYNTTNDLLINMPVNAMGYTYQMQNIGRTSNKGIEFNVNYAILHQSDYALNLSLNLSHNVNKVEKLYNGGEIQTNSGAFSTDLRERDDYRVFEGEPTGLVYGFVYDGVYTVDDFETYTDANGVRQFGTDASTKGQYILKEGVTDNTYTTSGSYGKLRPGAMKLRDLDGDKTITSKDRTIIGRTQPKLTGGFSLSGRYKWFDLAANFTYRVGGDVYNMDKMVEMQYYRNGWSALRPEMASVADGGQAWSYMDADGNLVTTPDELAALNANATLWSAATMSPNNPVVTSYFIEDGSYLRMQSLTFGATLPKNWTRSFHCETLRLYCTLSNLFCISNYSGYDPEVNSPITGTSLKVLCPGADYSSYPKCFSWTVGLNIKF